MDSMLVTKPIFCGCPLMTLLEGCNYLRKYDQYLLNKSNTNLQSPIFWLIMYLDGEQEHLK